MTIQNNSYLLTNFDQITGIGSRIADLLEKLTSGHRVIDLLYHTPSNVIVKNYLPNLVEVQDKEVVIIKVTVESYIEPKNKRQPFKILCSSPSGYLTIIFYKIFPSYIKKSFSVGSEIVLSGKIERFGNEIQISHPDYVFPQEQIYKIPKIEIIYPLVQGLNQKILRKQIVHFLSEVPNFPDWIDNNLLKQQNWQSWKECLVDLHNPKSIKDLDFNNLSRKRLAFDELLAMNLANLITKKHFSKENGTQTIATHALRSKLIEILPFKLTDGQKKSLEEIDADMVSAKQMLRLLQGDVGSGKTIIAFMALLSVVENKRQGAIIVPISLLALQHFKVLSEFSKKLGIRIEVLTSKTTKNNKKKILEGLQSGQINIIIGTHCLIEPDIVFKDLALIVIDEQHRFGVLQRLGLVEKGNRPDILLMSATPIPRSLMMTFYADMDISVLRQKPKNRIEINTRIISLTRQDEIDKALQRALSLGEKIYWICPLIEESQESEYSNVLQRYEEFRGKFGEGKVGIIHGKMKEKEKQKVMTDFAQNNIQLLVATTVIEVGIDVVDATIMVVENCERFGLSALHQLRGRVGRGDKKSYCLLLYGKALSQIGKKRLNIMRQTNDGFIVAEEDLKIRGAGQMFGTKQSGLPEYKIANLSYDLDLLNLSRKYAQFLLHKSESIKDYNKEPVKYLLRIFNYDRCIKLIQGG